MPTGVSFEQSLERCLQELSRSGDVDTALRRCPQYADELRPLLELALATSRHYENVPVAPGGLASGRERFLAAAAEYRAQGVVLPAAKKRTAGTRGPRMWLAAPLKFISAMLVVCLAMLALGGGVVWAASDSLPGDWLYPVKLAVEDVRLGLVNAPAGEVDLALQFVEERAREIEALAAAGRGVPDEAFVRIERHIERALNRAAWAGEDETDELLTQIQNRIQIQAQRLAGLHVQASQQALAGLQRAAAIFHKGAQAAAAGLADPVQFRAHYQHQLGEPQVTQEPAQERHQNRNTPVGTPRVTPRGPEATAQPAVTPQGGHTFQGTNATPQSPQATQRPQATPQGPAEDLGPKATRQEQPGAGGTEQNRQGPSGPDPTPGEGMGAPRSTMTGGEGTPEEAPDSADTTPEHDGAAPGSNGAAPGSNGATPGNTRP